jgi:hypothetical protein
MVQTTLYSFIYETLALTRWRKFDEVLDALAAGKKKILICSANGVGKTTLLAALCNWKLSTHKDSIVLTTASSYKHVRHNLWGEIRKQAHAADLYGGHKIRQDTIKLDEKHYAIAISPAAPENAQGFHSRSMLIAIDEATGVSREIINALLATGTGDDVQIVMTYNPMDTDSFVYEAERSGDWHVVTINAFEHPNVVRGTTIIEGAVTRRSISERMMTWSFEVEATSERRMRIGDTYWHRAGEAVKRILGEWAEEGGEGFIPMHLVKRSLENTPERGVKMMGVDVARGGKDETVFAFFDGGEQLPFYRFRSRDLLAVADKAREFYEKGFRILAIDDTGVGGGVTDTLRSWGIEPMAVHFAQAAKGFFRKQRKQLANARAEMYFGLDEELKKNEIRLCDDTRLHQELCSVRLRHDITSEAYMLESKDDIRRRLGRSPDRADATALARYALRLAVYANRKLLQ